MEREIGSLYVELQVLTEGLKGYGAIEATIRLRALGEIAAALGTDALLCLAVDFASAAPIARAA